ncbi:hypothetical protein ACFL2E_09865 [Thermodesulfobacteriota bacterium]
MAVPWPRAANDTSASDLEAERAGFVVTATRSRKGGARSEALALSRRTLDAGSSPA